MPCERTTLRCLAAAATTVTVLTLIAWLALARADSDGARAESDDARAESDGARARPRGAARTAAAASPENPLRTAAGGRFPVSGSVVERLPAGPYTYLRVRPATGGDDVWLAMMAGSAPTGDRVDAQVMGQKAHFHSRRLGRSFDLLLFASSTAPASSSHPIVSPAKGPQP
jgi:pyruvate/2-oxoglutarate dehydrogenase complex dihydrolipoamide acyltransferase (E2) component